MSDLLGQKPSAVVRAWAWLTRPSEFVELRQADAVFKLLNPVVPERCDVCRHYDWLNNEGLCPSCWQRLSGIGKWMSLRQLAEKLKAQ